MKDYAIAHFNGDLPLWKSYWLNSVLLANIAVFVVAFVVAFTFISSGVSREGYTFFATLAGIPIIVWSIVGTWRSASAYSAANTSKWWCWGRVAQVVLVLGMLKLFAETMASMSPGL